MSANDIWFVIYIIDHRMDYDTGYIEDEEFDFKSNKVVKSSEKL